jgi:hypothetical protein
VRSVTLGRGSGSSWRLLLNENIGSPECPLMRRWAVQTPVGGLRLHHFLRGDLDRELHDHPWWFLTLVLRGGYVDVSSSGEDVLRPGSVRFRPAGHAHRVETAGCWTLVLSGPVRRLWGFYAAEGWVPWHRFHAVHGNPACAEEERS